MWNYLINKIGAEETRHKIRLRWKLSKRLWRAFEPIAARALGCISCVCVTYGLGYANGYGKLAAQLSLELDLLIKVVAVVASVVPGQKL